MSKILFLTVLFSGVFANAETYYLNDFLFHLKNRINNSRDIGQLVSKTPGTLAQKTAFAKQVRECKIANQAPPKAQVRGTKLEIDLQPKLVIDFAQLDQLILTVNGKKLDLRTNKDWIGQFNSAYRPTISWIEFLIQKSYAKELNLDGLKDLAELHELKPINQSNPADQKDLENTLDKAVQKTSNPAESIFTSALATYARCKAGVEECSFFSDEGVIIEHLTEGEYRGLSTFQCEDGKLKKIQALKTKDEGRDKISSYEFAYTAGSDDVKIKVKNFGTKPKEKANCDFIFNSKTNEVRSDAKATNKCKIKDQQYLISIAEHTPLDAAFRCCQKKSCDEKVSRFQSDFTTKALKEAGESIVAPARAAQPAPVQ